MRILASNFQPLLLQRTTLRQETLVTEPHVGYSKDQIAQAVLDTELEHNPRERRRHRRGRDILPTVRPP